MTDVTTPNSPSTSTTPPSSEPRGPLAPPPNLPSQPMSSVPNFPPPSVVPQKPLATPTPQAMTPSSPPVSTAPAFSSSIRTMNNDLGSLKSGQTPVGSPVSPMSPKIEKKPETPMPLVTPPTSPKTTNFNIPPVAKPTTPPASITPSSVPLAVRPPLSSTLPPPQTPLAPKPTIMAPPPPSRITPSSLTPPPAPRSISIPPTIPMSVSSNPSSKRSLYLIVGLIVAVIGGVIIWLAFSRSPQVAVTPSPSLSTLPTPTPIVAPLEQAFGVAETLVVPDNASALQTLQTAIASQIVPTGTIKTFKLVNETNQSYSFATFLSHVLKITVPADLSAIDSSNWRIGIYSQLDALAMRNTLADIDSTLDQKGTPKNKVFIVAQIADKIAFTNIALAWESSAFQKEFAPLMGFAVPKTPASFKEDYYNGQPFRYLQATDRNAGLAYTTIDDFAIFGSSRDSFRAVIDALKH